MGTKIGNNDREVMVNHREDVLTEDLILEGIYRYTNFTRFGYSFDFLYVRQEQPSGDVTCPKWQIEEMKNRVLSDEQYEEIIGDMKSSTKRYLAYLKRFAKSLEKAAREIGLIREWFDESLKVTGTIARFYVEWGIGEEMNRRGIPVPAGRSEETDTTRVVRELRKIVEDHADEVREARDIGSPVRISVELEERLRKFCKRYGYLGMKYFTGHPWTLWEAYSMLLADKEGEVKILVDAVWPIDTAGLPELIKSLSPLKNRQSIVPFGSARRLIIRLHSALPRERLEQVRRVLAEHNREEEAGLLVELHVQHNGQVEVISTNFRLPRETAAVDLLKEIVGQQALDYR